jgi:hypothetical protein
MTNAFIHETAEVDEQVEIGSDTKMISSVQNRPGEPSWFRC